MLVQYPENLSTEALVEAISIVRQGEAVTQRDKLGLLLWNVQGSFQAIVLGHPADGSQLRAPHACFSDDLIESAAAAFQSELDKPKVAAADYVGVVDPATIMVIIQSVMALIQMIRDRRNKTT